MESPRLHGFITTYTGPENPEVARVGWSDGTVWLDAGKTSAREGHRATKPGTIGFNGVPEQVWNFQIGGYQVCHKWLKDRKGRTLSDEDVAHYQKIVVALSEAVRIMAEIDEVIEYPRRLAGRFPDRVGSGCGIGRGLSAAIVTGANAKLLRPGVVAYAGREVVVDVAGVDARGP